MKTKSIIKTILIMSMIIVIGGFAMIAAMTLVYSLPVNMANITESLDILSNEGARPDVLERNSGDWSNAESFEPGIVITTDEIANVYRAAGVEGASPLYNVIVMDAPEWGSYARYWHTHVAVMRVLFIFMDIKEMRFFIFIFQLLCVIAIMLLVRDRKGNIPALLVLTFYILNMPLSVSAFSDYSICMCWVLAFTFFILRWMNKTENKNAGMDSGIFFILFCIMGCMVCATDQLITCIISWALPILLIVYLYGEGRSIRDNLGTVVLSGLSWIFGYAGFWLFKLAFSTVYLHENIFEDAFLRSAAWTEGTEATSEGRLFSLITVYKHYTYKIFAVLIVLWVLYLVLRMVFSELRFDSRIPSLLLISLGPVTWGFVLYEHIYYHHIMTYRQFSAAIAAILFLLYTLTENSRLKFGLLKAGMNKYLIIVLALIPAFALTSLMSEKQDMTNADRIGGYVPFNEDGSAMVIDYVPSYDRITQIGFGINAVSGTGSFGFRLLDGESVIDEFVIPAEDFISTPFILKNVDWKLKAGRSYRIQIFAMETDPGCGLLVLTDAQGMLGDIRGFMNGSETVATQPITWIKYLRRPLRRDYVFYSISWYACLLAFASAGFSLLKNRRAVSE